MHGKAKGQAGNPSSTLIAFKPRQVILAEQSQKPPSSSSSSSKPTLMALADEKKQQQQHNKKLTPEQNSLLLHSVLRYIQANNFSKSLKGLLKDAQIQGDNWKAGTLDLEDIYSKYLENCSHVDTKLGNHKEREMLDDEQEHCGEAAASQETVSKKKKRKISEKDNGHTETDSEHIASQKDIDTESHMKLKKQKDKKMDPPSEAPPSLVCDSEVAKSSKKQKKKNKNTSSETLDQDAIQSDTKSRFTEQVKDDNGEVDFKEAAKSKDKKKKKKPSTDALVEDKNVNESKSSSTLADDKSNSEMTLEESEVKPKEKKRKKAEKENKSSVTLENGADEYNSTKKRKRLAAHENESQHVEEPAAEETKRRKIEGVEEDENVVQNGVQKSGQRKQQNGSAEPKTVNAFQRVKIDEVEFVDERLQDNSYWAKDGADIGYGAKAQEILGQVRGRDFRHEKTKKKRGSYRGGQIDLQSHSIKFNYSDEE